jgi:hypothetical protein
VHHFGSHPFRTFSERPTGNAVRWSAPIRPKEFTCPTLGPDFANLTRICELARRLHQLGEIDSAFLGEVVEPGVVLRRQVVVGEVVEGEAPYRAAHRAEFALDRVLAPEPVQRRAGLRPPGLHPRRLRRRLVGLHVDDPGRGAGRADPGEAGRRVVPAR